PCDADEVLARLNAQAPDGLSFTRVSVIPMRATAIPRRVAYTLPIPEDRVAETADRAEALMRADKVWVDRLRPSPKRLNIRPYVRSLTLANGPASAGRGTSAPRPADAGPFAERYLSLDFWVTQTGTARADELVGPQGLAGPP